MTPIETDAGTQSRPRNEGHGRRLTLAFDALEAFPALAESRNRLLRLVREQEASFGEIVQAVESDVALVIAVLRIANRAKGRKAGSRLHSPGPEASPNAPSDFHIHTPGRRGATQEFLSKIANRWVVRVVWGRLATGRPGTITPCAAIVVGDGAHAAERGLATAEHTQPGFPTRRCHPSAS
jgi:hypothetical protein